MLATFNERENVLGTIGGIPQHVPDPVEVIVLDGDSPDKTWKLLAEPNGHRTKIIKRVAI